MTKRKMVTFRASADEVALMRREAAQRGMTLSEFVRDASERAIGRGPLWTERDSYRWPTLAQWDRMTEEERQERALAFLALARSRAQRPRTAAIQQAETLCEMAGVSV